MPFNDRLQMISGHLERCALRPGNVHSADGWREVLEPVVNRYGDRKLRRYFRADAAFASIECRRNASLICSDDPLAVRPIMYGVTTPASAIGPIAGTRPAASWPRLSGIRASYFRVWGSSSLISAGLPSASSPSTISAARLNSTSRRARTPSTGPGYGHR